MYNDVDYNDYKEFKFIIIGDRYVVFFFKSYFEERFCEKNLLTISLNMKSKYVKVEKDVYKLL